MWRKNRFPFLFRIGIGLGLGILFARWQFHFLDNQVGFMDESTLRWLETVAFQPRELFLFMLRKMLQAYLILLLLQMSRLAGIGMTAICVCYGWLQGNCLGILLQRFGWSGMLLYGVTQFPGGFGYVVWLYYRFSWCREKQRNYSYREVIMELGFLLGCIWMQSYVNPFLLQKYLQVLLNHI